MLADEIATLATRLRVDAPASPIGLAVAARLDAVAADVAALESLPVPDALREPERRPARS